LQVKILVTLQHSRFNGFLKDKKFSRVLLDVVFEYISDAFVVIAGVFNCLQRLVSKTIRHLCLTVSATEEK